MKVSIGLKIATGIMLLLGLFHVAESLIYASRNSFTWVMVQLCVGIVTVVISIGIFRSVKIALYFAPVLGVLYFFNQLINRSPNPSSNLPDAIYMIYFLIFICLSVMCIIKSRQQA